MGWHIISRKKWEPPLQPLTICLFPRAQTVSHNLRHKKQEEDEITQKNVVIRGHP